jgi:ubiquinone/menaquinone biosynthesis C-methylase UbiE
MPGKRSAAAAVAMAAVGAVLLRERRNPQACPYSQRWMLHFPRPWISTDRLIEVLDPRPGERLLELGPGTGVQTLPVADRLRPGGVLDALDVQQEMVDDLMGRARDQGVTNLRPRQGDATEVPYEDQSFDGAYLVTVLGEIPDQDAALRELRRVLRPAGRVVFGETLLDPHFVAIGALTRRAEAAGLRFERKLGPAPGFYARFTSP